MPITPNMTNLQGLGGQSLTCSIGSPNLGQADSVESAIAASMTAVAGGVAIDPAAAGDGLWVPYIAGKAVYGYATAGANWMGTGPFSGCHVAFFTDGARVGLAHIAKESGTSASSDAWDAFIAQPGITLLNEFKVPLPDPTQYSCSYVFVDLAAAKIQVTQVDMTVGTMGGGDGTIYKVSKLA